MSDVYLITLLAVLVLLGLNLFMLLRVSVYLHRQIDLRRRRSADTQLPVGRPAPPFRARTIGGTEIALEDLQRATALVFVSPSCGACRSELPELGRLSSLASSGSHTDIVLVSNEDTRTTREWLSTIAREDKVSVDLPVLIPIPDSTFLLDYNPGSSNPYFVLLDETRNVAARSLLVEPDWLSLTRRWKATQPLLPWAQPAG